MFKFQTTTNTLLKNLPLTKNDRSNGDQDILLRVEDGITSITTLSQKSTTVAYISTNGEGTGFCTVPAPTLNKILKNNKNKTIEFTFTGMSLYYNTGVGEIELPNIADASILKGFPPQKLKNFKRILFRPERLKKILQKINFAIGTDYDFPYACVLYITNGELVATNRYVLATAELPELDPQHNLQLPKSTITALLKTIKNTPETIELQYNKNNHIISIDDQYFIYGDNQQHQFPNYKNALPDNIENLKNIFTINRENFIQAGNATLENEKQDTTSHVVKIKKEQNKFVFYGEHNGTTIKHCSIPAQIGTDFTIYKKPFEYITKNVKTKDYTFYSYNVKNTLWYILPDIIDKDIIISIMISSKP